MGERKSIRLKGWDYGGRGVYFVTVDVEGHGRILGEIKNGAVKLNDCGLMVEKVWLELPKRFGGISFGEYCVMPNHVHGIVVMKGVDGATARATTRVARTAPIAVGAGFMPAQKDANTAPIAVGAGFMPAQKNANTAPIAVGAGFMPAQKDANTAPIAVGAGFMPAQKGFMPAQKSLGDIIGAFKSISTREYIKGIGKFNWPRFNGRLWQRNFFERIIRSQKELHWVENYIRNNPTA